jgi:hypothetical protein
MNIEQRHEQGKTQICLLVAAATALLRPFKVAAFVILMSIGLASL